MKKGVVVLLRFWLSQFMIKNHNLIPLHNFKLCAFYAEEPNHFSSFPCI
jgi:hypothetical protein